SSFAADTLADAFKNGTVKGQLKAWYFDRTNEDAATNKNANVLALGVELNYVTDSLYGFYAGATFQGAAQPWIEDDAEAKFRTDMHASGAVLSEAYLGYKLGKTDVKVGRQYISTPLVNGSGSRIFKESFEGVVLVNTDLPQTTLFAGYVDKFQGRTSAVMGDADGDEPSFKHRAVFGNAGTFRFDNAYTAGVINKSISNLTLTAQYVLTNDVETVNRATQAGDVDVYYAEAGYVLPMSNFKLGFDANYRASRTDKDVDMDGYYTAARISLKDLAGFGASFAYGTTSNKDLVILGAGNGPSTYTGSLIRASTETARANTDSYLFTATYDLSKVGVTGLGVLAQYGKIEQDKKTGVRANDTEFTSYVGAVTYDVAALKGLSFALQYETQENDTDGASKFDQDELRFLANYKF
ncbi:MAG: outer membrane porin, OprD family, partial [Bacteroidia bacterium]|nr:outer membrane porin, OprD family [Bacteroidia bacterium]